MISICSSSYAFERSNDELEEFNIETVSLDPSFQKSISKDSVQYFLASLIPIARPAETKNILATLRKSELNVKINIVGTNLVKSANVNRKNYSQHFCKHDVIYKYYYLFLF